VLRYKPAKDLVATGKEETKTAAGATTTTTKTAAQPEMVFDGDDLITREEY
jgi:hypothetical protein